MKASELHENLKCPICIEFVEEPIECQECFNIFCFSCLYSSEKSFKFKDCPMCRKIPNFKESQFAKRLLRNIQVECPNDCGELVSRGELKEHIAKCENKQYECSVCLLTFKQKIFFEHLTQNHKSEIISAFDNKTKIADDISKISLNQINSKVIPKSEVEIQTDVIEQIPLVVSVIDNNSNSQNQIEQGELLKITLINRKGNKMFKGNNELYYCGKKSDVICNCCDGYCGPQNGCLCSHCMDFNLKYRTLPPGVFINENGKVCKFINNSLYCDTPIKSDKGIFKRLFDKEKCNPMYHPCSSCTKLTKLMGYYT
jgi:hypothetical protein